MWEYPLWSGYENTINRTKQTAPSTMHKTYQNKLEYLNWLSEYAIIASAKKMLCACKHKRKPQ